MFCQPAHAHVQVFMRCSALRADGLRESYFTRAGYTYTHSHRCVLPSTRGPSTMQSPARSDVSMPGSSSGGTPDASRRMHVPEYEKMIEACNSLPDTQLLIEIDLEPIQNAGLTNDFMRRTHSAGAKLVPWRERKNRVGTFLECADRAALRDALRAIRESPETPKTTETISSAAELTRGQAAVLSPEPDRRRAVRVVSVEVVDEPSANSATLMEPLTASRAGTLATTAPAGESTAVSIAERLKNVHLEADEGQRQRVASGRPVNVPFTPSHAKMPDVPSAAARAASAPAAAATSGPASGVPMAMPKREGLESQEADAD